MTGVCAPGPLIKPTPFEVIAHATPSVNFRLTFHAIKLTLMDGGENERRNLLEQFQRRHHSITSSARASSVGGTVTPNAFAVLRLMTNSNCVGCRTGISAGFAPLRIWPT